MPRWTDAGQRSVPVFARGCNSDGWGEGYYTLVLSMVQVQVQNIEVRGPELPFKALL